MLLDVFYSTDSNFKGDLFVRFYKFSGPHDSSLVLSKDLYKCSYKRGINKIKVDFSKVDTYTFCERKFLEVLKRTENIAPGSYKVLLSVRSNNTIIRNEIYLREIDSILSPNSPVRKDINKSLTPKTKFLGIWINRQTNNVKIDGGTALRNRRKKADKATKRRGLRSEQHQKKGKTYNDLFYQDWFAGRYEVNDKEPLAKQIKRTEDLANAPDPTCLTNNELGSPSLFSQYKTLNDKKNNDEMKGTISMTTTSGNSQEQNSGVDNNYYELKTVTEIPIIGIPMQLEGYYTSQDVGRAIKSSYYRLHYDVMKMKDELAKSIRSYNTGYSASSSKLTGAEQIYNSAVSKLEAQRSKLHNKNKKGGNGNGLENELDKEAIEDIDKKIEKYKTLLAQQKNSNYFDSSLVYDKLKKIGDTKDMSYKKMVKNGSGILPENKAKGLLTGVTTIDIGMFPKYTSRYTMSGQMIKGIDLGYDPGFCETGLTVGKTEFVGRDGSLDKYTCYSTKVSIAPIEKQKIGIIYYGYSTDRKLYSADAFFKKVDISSPSFFEPVHIVATTYTGSISKYVTIEGEAATSLRNTDKNLSPLVPQANKMAYHLGGDGKIPGTSISLGLGYDKIGIGFENKTLPMSMVGTEQYKATARTDLLCSLFNVGVEFNRLIQRNFTSTGRNTKWGFDAKTNFKKYPNAAVSYKPYTTFHYYTDTLAIPQRPMFGSVSTGKITYQLKRKEKSWRFSLMYNECKTTMDTTSYSNSTTQGMCMYSDRRLSQSMTIGSMNMAGAQSGQQSTQGKTNFISLCTGYNMSKRITISIGQDIGTASFGLCRLAANGGVTYRPTITPVTIRVAIRYSTYLLSEHEKWKKVYGGSIDIAYRFKAKIR